MSHPYTRGYFEGDGTGYLGLYRDFATHWRIINLLKTKQLKSVLDVGASRGYICKHLEAELGIKAVAMDISEHAFHTRATDSFVLHDARKAPWPFKDKEFDMCISLSFMEHLTEEEISIVIKEMARVSERAYLTITFEKTPQDVDVTHRTFKSHEWWITQFEEFAPNFKVEIMTVEEAKLMEQTPIIVPQPDGLVKLNIGCFLDQFYYGFENIDSQDLNQFAQQNGYIFRQYDVRHGIQKPDDSTDIILASHFIEHLSKDEGAAFLRECHRVLKPNGILRLVIPDSKLLAKKYLDGTIMDYKYVNIGVEQTDNASEALFHLLIAGHQTMYDFESLSSKLERTGAWKIKQVKPFESQSEAIKKQTVPNYPTLSCYIEATKLEDHFQESGGVTGSYSISVGKVHSVHKDKLKIALISTPMLKVFPANYGGLESVCGDLCEALAKIGHEVTVFAPNGSKVEGCRVIETGEALEKVNVDWLQAERAMYEKIKGYLQEFDIIHGMNWFGMEYAFKSLHLNSHVCHTHHGGANPDWWSKTKPNFPLNFIAISNWMVRVYSMQGLTAKRCYNGINMANYPFKKRKGERFLFLSRISKFKAPHVAVEVAKKAGVPLDVVGATTFVDDPNYVVQVKSMCDGEHIKFIGEVSHEDKLRYLQNAKALIVPGAWGEPFGLHVVESLCVGTPVIALADGGIVETMDNGKTGFLCNNVDELAEATKKVPLIKPLKCREHVEKYFSREVMAKSYEKLYLDILEGREW